MDTHPTRHTPGLAVLCVIVGVVLAVVFLLAGSSAEPLPVAAIRSAASSGSGPALSLSDPSAISPRRGSYAARGFLVHIAGPDGRPYQGAWELAVRSPSEAPLDLVFAAGSDDRHLDLAHGRWKLQPSALGLTAHSIVVDVDATTSEVSLQFLVAAQVFGSILDDRGEPVIGLPIGLRSLDGRLTAQAISNGAGTFEFLAIPQGTYELLAGREESPLRPTLIVEVVPGRQVLAPLRTAALGESTVRIVTEDGSPVADAIVEGTGARGGGFRGSTGADGTLLARFLPPGRYRVTASRADLGVGEGRFELLVPGPASAAIMLRR